MSSNSTRSPEPIEVAFRKSTPLSNPRVRYQGFDPHERILPAGTVMREGARALTCDILFQRDVPVKLRDGITIYTDVFRPVGEDVVPAIVAWSPYGKNLGSWHLDDFPFRMGVAQHLVSELNKWEAPDPAVWCAKGYAVVNPDARGAYSSDGDGQCWNSQEGRDGADLIGWVGMQPWCNGKVGMAGNSWLAAAQWFIAAERPRHLAAIAPWEGLSDVYRNFVCAGGIPDPRFMDVLTELNAGRNRIEDVVEMLARYPLFNSYWENHAARVEQIEVPAYVVASWSSPLHVQGTFDAYDRLRGPKWLRVHHTQEWPDFYDPRNQEDLGRFFDRYLKGIDNGWEATPKVRVSVLSAGPDNATVINRAEPEFPPARTTYGKLYLDARSRTLSTKSAEGAAHVEYSAAESEQVIFEHRFVRSEEWLGFLELVLHVEAKGVEDLDLFIRTRKLSRSGAPFLAPNLPLEVPEVRAAGEQIAASIDTPSKLLFFYEGPWGRIRASHREIDPKKSRIARPVLTHRTPAPLKAGEIVEVRIALTPTGMEFKQGETLQLIIDTRNQMEIPIGTLPTQTIGIGKNLIHTGGSHQSYLLVPVVDQS